MTLYKAKLKLALLVAGLSLLSMPISSFADYVYNDEADPFASSVGRACGGGASGNFQMFTGAYSEGCDYVGEFDMVTCFGNRSGRVSGTVIIRIRQSDCNPVNLGP